jgi:hypothetical protein
MVEEAYADDYKVSDNFVYSWQDLIIRTSRTIACDGRWVYVVEDKSNNTLFHTGTSKAVTIKLVNVCLSAGASYEIQPNPNHNTSQ